MWQHYSIWDMPEAVVWGIIEKLMMSGINICRYQLSRIKDKIVVGVQIMKIPDTSIVCGAERWWGWVI